MQFKYEDLEYLAKEKEDENWEFRKFLKFCDMSDDELDQLVFKIADQVGSTIDCTICGRCCKELRPALSEGDQKRLAARLELNVEQLRGKYLQYDDTDEREWRMKASPCSFHKDNKCIVYEDRPQNCRDYPYLHESGFSYRTIGMIERTFTCPIVFIVMEELFQSAMVVVTVCFLIFPLIALVLYKKWLPNVLKSRQDFLASTEWARSQGLKAEDIQLYNWQK